MVEEMTTKIRTKNGLTATVPMPQDNRGATFNDGAFVVGAAATLATVTFTEIGLTTGLNQVVFSGFQITTESGNLLIQIYGESAFTGGTPLTAYNTNKNSSNLPSVTAITQDPTVSVQGDLQFPLFAIKGNNTDNTINSVLSQTPMILIPETSYIFRMTHNDTGTKDVGVLLTAFDNIIDQPTFGKSSE